MSRYKPRSHIAGSVPGVAKPNKFGVTPIIRTVISRLSNRCKNDIAQSKNISMALRQVQLIGLGVAQVGINGIPGFTVLFFFIKMVCSHIPTYSR